MLSRILRKVLNDPTKTVNRETLIEAGVKPEQLPLALHEVISANDETSLTPLLMLSRDIFDPYQVDPRTGYPPLVAALKNKNAKCERRWDQVLEIISSKNIEVEKTSGGYALLIAAKENSSKIELLTNFIKDSSHHSASNGFYPEHWAVINENALMLKTLLEHNACVNRNTKHKDMMTPLDLALSKDNPNIDVLECLLRHNADVNHCLENAANAFKWDKVKLVLKLDSERTHVKLASLLLRIAVSQDRPDLISYLLQYGAELTCTMGNVTSNSANYAASDNKWSCIQAMLEHQNKAIVRQSLHIILAIAAANEKWDIVQQILDMNPALHDASIQEQQHNGYTTVQWLIKHNQNSFLHRVISLGICINGSLGIHLAIQTAVYYKNETAFNELVQKGESAEPVWIQSVAADNWDNIDFLLQHDKCISSDTTNRLIYGIAMKGNAALIKRLLVLPGVSIKTAVDAAIRQASWDALKLLLSDADPSYRINNFSSATLETFITSSRPDMVQLLLDHGVVTHNAERLIHDAATNGDWDIVKIFVDHKEFSLSCHGTIQLIKIAIECSRIDIIKSIFKNGRLSLEDYQSEAALIAENTLRYPDVIEGLINAGLDVNYPCRDQLSLIDHAVALGQRETADILVKRGAHNHQTIINAAGHGDSDKMFNLIDLHYNVRPNKNETPDDKRILVGKLLHVCAEKFDISVFRKLLEMGADLGLVINNKNILELLAERYLWSYLLDVLKFISHSPDIDQPILANILIMCINKHAPINVINALVDNIKNLDAIKESKTGNNLLQVSIRAEYTDCVQLFTKLGISKGSKNARRETVFTMLQDLATYERGTAEKLSLIVYGSTEWLISSKVERSSEGVGIQSVKVSISRSMMRLKNRYGVVNVERAVADYHAFLNSLTDSSILIHGKPYLINAGLLKDGGRYRNIEHAILNKLAYIWTAACDETALTAEQVRTLTTKDDIADMIKLRKLAIAERLQDAKIQNKCTNGTLTFLTEALFHAHPDIYVLYDNSFINAEINEVVANKFADLVPKTLNRLWTNAQRTAVKEFHQDPTKPMTFLSRVSDRIKSEMKQEYMSDVPPATLERMVSPEQINKLQLNLPPHFTRLVAVLNTINDLINRCTGLMPVDEITHLQKLSTDALSTSIWPRSIKQECEFLESELEYCLDKCFGISYQGLSMFTPARALNETPETPKLKM